MVLDGNIYRRNTRVTRRLELFKILINLSGAYALLFFIYYLAFSLV